VVIDLGDVRRHEGLEAIGPSNAKDLHPRPAENGDDRPPLCRSRRVAAAGQPHLVADMRFHHSSLDKGIYRTGSGAAHP
jgi:hypothetical protein